MPSTISSGESTGFLSTCPTFFFQICLHAKFLLLFVNLVKSFTKSWIKDEKKKNDDKTK